MTDRPEPIPFAVWGKRLKTDGADRQLETLVGLVTSRRVLAGSLVGEPISLEGEATHRAAVMAENEAASYQEGKG